MAACNVRARDVLLSRFNVLCYVLRCRAIHWDCLHGMRPRQWWVSASDVYGAEVIVYVFGGL